MREARTYKGGGPPSTTLRKRAPSTTAGSLTLVRTYTWAIQSDGMVRRDATWDIGRPLSPVPQAAIAKVDIPPYATPGPPPGRPRTPRCSRDASGVPGLWGRVQVVWEGLCPNGRPILSLLCLTLFLFSFSLGVLLVSLSLLSSTLCLITLVYIPSHPFLLLYSCSTSP